MTEKRIHDAFAEIKADDALKQKTLQAVCQKSAPQKHFPLRLVVSAVIVLAALFGSILSYTIPVYAISVDDAASVELKVNMYQRVVSVQTYGSSCNTSAIANMSYEDAVNAILADKSDLTNVVITVAGGSSAGCQKMVETLKTCKGQCMGNAVYEIADEDVISEAGRYNMSMGKYKAYLLLKEKDSSITIEQVQNMTMQEIHQMTGQCSEGMGQMKGKKN